MKKRNLKVTTFNTNTKDKNGDWIENHSEEGGIINTQLRKLFRVIKNNIGTLTPKKAKQYKLMISDLTKGSLYMYTPTFYKKTEPEYLKSVNDGSLIKAKIVFRIREDKINMENDLEKLKKEANSFAKNRRNVNIDM